MFNDIKDQNSPSSLPPQKNISPPPPPPKKAEDIFADTEKGAGKPPAFTISSPSLPEKPAVFQPKEPGLPQDEPGAETKTEADVKKFVILGSIILAVVLILGGSWYGYVKFFKGQSPKSVDLDQEQKKSEGGLTPQEEGAAPVIEQAEEGEEIPAKPLDSDEDGLTDEEEKELGMNINEVDTDSDGLFDREEVKVYKTDPKNPDTDGDGYLDGDEVKNGYNPKGAGKLFKIE